MPLIKNGAAADDSWTTALTPDELGNTGPLIVTLELWQAHRERLLGRNGPLGIRLASNQAPDLIAGDLHRLDLVALEFPKFADGRAYSHARLLRERHGFDGELRAVGNVLRDQLLFMVRCGFDSFEVADDRPLDGWEAALSEIDIVYQPAADRRAPVTTERSERPAVAANWAY